MSGILNHPKMPVVAGSLALALLVGGIYSSLDEGTSSAPSVTKGAKTAAPVVAAVPSPQPSTSGVTAQFSQQKNLDIKPAQVENTVSSAAKISPTEPATAAEPVSVAQPAIAMVKASRPTQTPVTRTVSVAQSAPAPVTPVQPVLAQTASAQQVAVRISPVAPVVLPDEAPSPVTPSAALSVVPKATPDIAPTTAAAVVPAPASVEMRKPAKLADANSKKHKKRASRVENEDSDDSNQADEAAPAKAQNTTAKAEASPVADSDYTEIKGAASAQTLAPETSVRAQSSAPATPATATATPAYKPAFVAASGGQAWVKISPERTIAVKSGDVIPGLGKVTGVSNTSVETEKGKLSKE